jgi:hypothetical protein
MNEPVPKFTEAGKGMSGSMVFCWAGAAMTKQKQITPKAQRFKFFILRLPKNQVIR